MVYASQMVSYGQRKLQLRLLNEWKQGQKNRRCAWGKTVDIISKYLQKGNEIAVEGKLVSRSYDDKNGNKKYVTEIVVNELLMLGNKA